MRLPFQAEPSGTGAATVSAPGPIPRRRPVGLGMVCALLMPVLTLSAQPRVKAVVSDLRVVQGTSISLEVRSEGGDIRSVSMVGLKDFDILAGPSTSRSVQIINGVVSATSSYSWTLLPRKSGRVVIPALAVNVEGIIEHTAPVTLEVLPPASAAAPAGQASQSIYLVAEVDKADVYRGEQITVSWTLYTQLSISGWELTSFPNLTGFWTEELFAPNKLQLREKVIRGRRYYAAVVRRQALFPTRSGELEIDPMIMKIGVQSRSRRRGDPFFDEFSIFNRGRVKQKVLSAPVVHVHVRPIPRAGRPPDYTGMVGRYSLVGLLDPRQVTQDEAVTLTLTISGDGNVKALEYPAVNLSGGLEVFEPKVTTEPSLGDIVGGSTTIEYVVIPRREGSFTIPEIRLPFFDPALESFQVSNAGPFTLTVLPRLDALATAPGYSRREVALLGKDIRFVREGRPRWLRTEKGWYTPGLLILNLATIFIFVAPGLGARVRSVVTAAKPAFQSRRALSMAHSAVDQAGGELAEVHAAFSLAVTGYLNHKLLRQTQEYTPEQVRDLLIAKQVSPAVQAGLVELLERAAAARFAPAGGMDSEADRPALKQLLTQVEAQWPD